MLIGLVAGLTHASSALAQYKWIDAQGSVHYSDLPPPRSARSLVRSAVPGSASAATQVPGSSGAAQGQGPKLEPDALSLQGLPGALARLARQAPVVFYAIAACSPCDEGRALLQARGIPYTERRIDTLQDQQAMPSLGLPETGFPILSVGTERSVGYESGVWHRLLDDAGYPPQSMLPAQWRPAPARRLSTLIEPTLGALQETKGVSQAASRSESRSESRPESRPESMPALPPPARGLRF
jgi:hypothetical protein